MKALVTGGGGFLGGAIVRILRARGDEVVSFSRGAHPEIAVLGVACVRGDLADARALARAARGADVVFHAAAKAGVWGERAEYERVNVEGTRNVIDACLAARVPRLVHTSSPSVCFDGRDHLGASNDLPYARRFLAAYPESKAAAEKLVIAANGASGLSTCALRPHLIFGPGDPHLVPRLLERARAGKLAVVGSGKNRVSLCFIDNAAHAHVDAADRLHARAAHAGRAYFLAQSEPVVLWHWIATLLARLEIAPLRRRVPLCVAYAAGGLCEAVWTALARQGEPPMTRFVALELAASHVYDLGPAQRDFGYVERVAMDEATRRLVRALVGPDVERRSELSTST